MCTSTRVQPFYGKSESMTPRLIRCFLIVSGILLLFTAVAKFISAYGNAHILQHPDAIFDISYRQVFWILGTFELIIALGCLFNRRLGLQAGLVAWLATAFVIYRVGLLWIGYHRPCSCLGNLTDALHILPQTADMAMKVILAYLLIGSYASMFWLWRQKRKTSPVTSLAETSV